MEGFIIFLVMFIVIPFVLYIFAKNDFGGGKYNQIKKGDKEQLKNLPCYKTVIAFSFVPFIFC